MVKSLVNWFRYSNLLTVLLGPPDPLPTVEQWAARVSTMGTPDEILVGGIVESIAKNFHDWKLDTLYAHGSSEIVEERAFTLEYEAFTEKPGKKRRYDNRMMRYMLTNSKTQTKVVFKLNFWRGYEQSWPNYSDVDGVALHINGVPLEPADLATKVWNAHYSIGRQLAETERVAKEALERQRANERKWDLVESMMGLTRNEQGALVPKSIDVEVPEPKRPALVEPFKKPRRRKPA